MRMGDLEIERKYLLSALPDAARGARSVVIEQGYLPGVRIVERLRRYQGTGTERWVRSIKAGTGITRIEVEEEVTRVLFEQLWPLTEGKRVRKRRYYLPEGGVTWEVDDFLDRELVLAELELPHESHRVHIPEWLAPVLLREVSHEPAYLNTSLAR
ncbi:MAG: CYTH domain-containing protein [Gemmatimonadaceae bacterium]